MIVVLSARKSHSTSKFLFLITKALQSKLQKGDIFEVSAFLLGQPLSLPYIIRDGQRTSPFIAGRNGGLTLINQAHEK